MSKILLTAVVSFLVGASTAAVARGGGGMSGGMGGMSGSHMSSQGMANTNGPESADRDTGLSRAEDRQSATAASHEKATRKVHRKSKDKGMSSQQ
jgi:hypothetical protein